MRYYEINEMDFDDEEYMDEWYEHLIGEPEEELEPIRKSNE